MRYQAFAVTHPLIGSLISGLVIGGVLLAFVALVATGIPRTLLLILAGIAALANFLWIYIYNRKLHSRHRTRLSENPADDC